MARRPLRGSLDHGVACVMSESVVDGLDVVEVDEHHCRERRWVGLQCLGCLRLGIRPIRESGERVVVGLVAELKLCITLVGDVGK